MKKGETLWALAVAYGYKGPDWKKIWDAKNAELVRKRGKPENLQAGDTRNLTADANGATYIVERDGEPGKRLSWVQTVYQHNQPIGSTKTFCVDGCPADDNLPFYWTGAEVASPPQWVQDATGNPKVNLRKTFAGSASRAAPHQGPRQGRF